MKSQRTKALEIPIKVKRAVAERDSIDGHPCCIWCGKPAPLSDTLAFSNAHVLRRSLGGKGTETNIVTLCWNCHQRFDGGDKKMMIFICNQMKRHYGGEWSIKQQMYKKENNND